MQKIIILLTMLFFSCSQLKESKGEYNEIVVLCSKEDKEYLFILSLNSAVSFETKNIIDCFFE